MSSSARGTRHGLDGVSTAIATAEFDQNRIRVELFDDGADLATCKASRRMRIEQRY